MQDAGRGGKGRPGGRVGQVRHAPRTTQAHGAVEHPHGHFADAGELARAAGQHQAGAGLDWGAGGLQAVAEQF